jgi:hypothetical protein
MTRGEISAFGQSARDGRDEIESARSAHDHAQRQTAAALPSFRFKKTASFSTV